MRRIISLLTVAALAAAPALRAQEAVESQAPVDTAASPALDERASLRLRYGVVARAGVQELDQAPILQYQGLTPNDVGLKLGWFAGAGWLGAQAEVEREAFALSDSTGQVTGGALVRAAVGPVARFGLGPLRVDVGAAYAFSQLPDFTYLPAAPTRPVFVAAQRHALALSGRLRLELPLSLRLEARGALPLTLAASDGQGGQARAVGYALGAALAIPLSRTDTLGASLVLDVQLTADQLTSGQATQADAGSVSRQALLRGSVALELAWLLPAPPRATGEAGRDQPARVAPEPGPRLGALAITVLDKQTGAPVPEARVRVGERELSAGPTGRLEAKELPPGPTGLSASAPGYLPLQEAAVVVAGASSPVSLELVREAAKVPATLTGLVRSTLGGRPVPALLEIPQAKVKTKASAAGAFSVRVPGGRYDVIISAPGYRTQSKTVTLKDGEQAIFNVDLHPERRGQKAKSPGDDE